ncbi:MAG: hypothetical protein ICV77_09475 [Cyanobacteria bacterium Co-bin8]|nr:hypothetical protein [Cyanobacteria bacterium Co-bin8]
MQHTTATHDHEHRERERIRRRDLLNSLLIGSVLGAILIGAPAGWFAHRAYAQQRMAQVLLCRQQNFGLPEAQLQSRCGNPL